MYVYETSTIENSSTTWIQNYKHDKMEDQFLIAESRSQMKRKDRRNTRRKMGNVPSHFKG